MVIKIFNFCTIWDEEFHVHNDIRDVFEPKFTYSFISQLLSAKRGQLNRVRSTMCPPAPLHSGYSEDQPRYSFSTDSSLVEPVFQQGLEPCENISCDSEPSHPPPDIWNHPLLPRRLIVVMSNSYNHLISVICVPAFLKTATVMGNLYIYIILLFIHIMN